MAVIAPFHDAFAAIAQAWRGERAARLFQLHYAVAAALAVAALGLTRLLLRPMAGAHFVLSLGAVCLATMGGGSGPGLLALAICTAGYPFLVAADVDAGGLTAPDHVVRVGLFVLVGVAEALGAGTLRRGRGGARAESDPSERRRARQRRLRLRVREQLGVLRMMTTDLAEGIAALDADGRIEVVNATAARILGWAEEELVGRSFEELVRPHRRSGEPERAEDSPVAVLRHGRTAQGQDLWFHRKDGTELPVSYTSSAILRRGRIAGVVLTFQDFSAHVLAEEAERFIASATEALTQSIEWERTLERVARLAIPFLGDWCLVVLDDDRGLRAAAAAHVDPAIERAVGELLRRYPIDRDAEHGVGRVVRTGTPELVPEIDLDAFTADRGAGSEARSEILRRIGTRSYMGVPLVAHGRTLGAIAFGISAGPRRYGERDLEVAHGLAARCALAIDNARLYRDSNEASRARDELLAVVSHDLRAPLAAVQLAAGVLARRVGVEGSPDLMRVVDTVKRATARAARLVDDLVDSARLERGRLALQRSQYPAAALAREALAVAEPLAREHGVSLTLEAAPDSGAVDCDRHRVLQVLANLIGNALKVMPGGGAIRLGVRRERGEVVFEVADTGPGIAADDLPHVFDRYWRSAGASYEGSGLGLAIARGIVEAHGGEIRVRSAPGEGATFTFTLPAPAEAGKGEGQPGGRPS